MKSLTVDTNVFVSAFSPDEGLKSDQELIEKLGYEEINIWVPAIITFEMGNVLHRKILANQLSWDNQEDIMDFFFNLPIILVWNRQLVSMTTQIQKECEIKSFYDASYIAVAMIKEAPLLSHDLNLVKKGRKIYPHIFTEFNSSMF